MGTGFECRIRKGEEEEEEEGGGGITDSSDVDEWARFKSKVRKFS